MARHSVVIVESPAKAKTINKYLGSGYSVIASMGHIRDLPGGNDAVRPDQDFAMTWEVSDRGAKQMRAIASAVRDSDRVVLATDPDREGEAISWHIAQVLEEKKLLKNRQLDRVTFNEITRPAVTRAMANPRSIDDNLVEAYLARRALDRLVGFTLSNVLWRKVPGSKSAGRVQSVALRLICERETEIEQFRPQEYWTIHADLTNAAGESFTARLVAAAGRKLGQFDIPNQQEAERLAALVRTAALQVQSLEEKQVRENPPPPFITSTLQMAASRRLGLGAAQTMRIAQQLYEDGLITYMRTDGTQLSDEAIQAIRGLIGQDFGDRYLPEKARIYRTKAKNAQEAHEAIRPTDMARRPGQVGLSGAEARLYEMIWQRTLACQMEAAVFNRVTAEIGDAPGAVGLRAVGSVLVFDGFLKVYGVEVQEDKPAAGSEAAEDAADRRLPALARGEALGTEAVRPAQHMTKPPPRYTEASLVKRMEELGIGRPSTYASILQVLQDRDYVRLDQRRFVPEDRGRIVTTFLERYFPRYVEYDFTAGMEEELDDISGGRADWRAVLRKFWEAFDSRVRETSDLTLREVIDALDAALGDHFFPARPAAGPGEAAPNPRACPVCGTSGITGGGQPGRLSLKLSRNGAFIGCSNYPACSFTRPLEVLGEDDAGGGAGQPIERLLGEDPETGLPVALKNGPYGPYVQLGPAPAGAEPAPPAPPPEPEPEQADGAKPKRRRKPAAPKPAKPKRASLLAFMAPAEMTLEQALKLLTLPRDLGLHPDDGEPVLASVGQYGPYLKHGSRYLSLPKDDDTVLTIGLNRAVTLLAEPQPARGQRGGRAGSGAAPLRELGPHPETGAPVTLHSGRYGPYAKSGAVNATIPRGRDPAAVTLEEAVALLRARAEAAGSSGSGGGAKGAGGRRAPAARRGGTGAKAPAETPAKAAAKTPAKAPARKRPSAAATATATAATTTKPASRRKTG